MVIRLRLKDLLFGKKMSQKELSKITGIRESVISEMSRNVRTGVNIKYLERISTALGIKDIREIIEMRAE